VTPSRIVENFKEVELSPEDIAEIETVGKEQRRYNIPFTASKFLSTTLKCWVHFLTVDLQTNLVGMSTFSEKMLRNLLPTKSSCPSKEHRLEVKWPDATAHVDHLAIECLVCQSL
jgi:hypothetical protein